MKIVINKLEFVCTACSGFVLIIFCAFIAGAGFYKCGLDIIICICHVCYSSSLQYRLLSEKWQYLTSLDRVSGDSSRHDPLAQQTSCLKCLSGLTLRVWIPEFVCYVICLRERCGLSFFFTPPSSCFQLHART